MEIVIGRDTASSQLKLTSGSQSLLYGKPGCVPSSVGEQHCKLVLAANKMHIVNIDINNYTYVNGHAIESARVSFCDQIVLGKDGYTLDWEAVVPLATGIAHLQKVWEEHEEQLLKLQTSERRFNILRSATGLITMIAIALGLITGRQSNWLLLLYALAIIVSLAFMIKAWRDAARTPQRIQQLNQQFQLDYSCPHCHRFLGNQSFQILSQNDNCPYCKTHFIL